MRTEVFIGMNITKLKLDGFNLVTGEILEFKNNPAGIKTFLKYARKAKPTLITCESTKTQDKFVISPKRWANRLKPIIRCHRACRVRLSNASRVNHTAPEELRALEAIMSRRTQILEMITMENNRLGSTRDANARASLETVIEFLKEQVSDMDSQMLELVRSNLELKTLDELLQSVPGVGSVLSGTLLWSLPELGSASRGCISSLVGVAPLNHDSGSHRGVGFIRAGCGNVRSVLYMGILSAVRHNPVLRVMYERLVLAGKAKMVALVACMHKLLIVLNVIVRDRKPWVDVTKQELVGT